MRNDMTEYNEGDLVEAVKGETVIRGPLVNICGLGRSLCLKLTLGIETDLIHLEANGFTITVIEKAAPVVVLPTKPGAYMSNRGSLWVLDDNHHWLDFSAWSGNVNNVAAANPAYHPFTRLEPVSETAKKVLRALGDWWDFAPPANVTAAIIDIAAKFGAEL